MKTASYTVDLTDPDTAASAGGYTRRCDCKFAGTPLVSRV